MSLVCEATMCDAPNGLRRTREAHPEHPHGHVYASSTGSWGERDEVSGE